MYDIWENLIPQGVYKCWCEFLAEIKNKMINNLMKYIPDGDYHFDGVISVDGTTDHGVNTVHIRNGTVILEDTTYGGEYDLDDVPIDDVFFVLTALEPLQEN